MIDLIKQIELGNLTLDEGEDLIDQTIEDYHNHNLATEWWQYLGFNEFEVTAFAHGGTLADLIYFRTKGWPEECSRCGFSLDIHRFGWQLVHVDDGSPIIHHLVCPLDE